MFTPPPSPLPSPVGGDSSSSPPLLTLSTPAVEKGYLSADVSPSPKDPKSPGSAEAARPRDVLQTKKRSGRRILLLVAILPTVLALSAYFRHFVPCLMSTRSSGGHKSGLQPLIPEESKAIAPSATTSEPPSPLLSPLMEKRQTSGDVPSIPSVPVLPTPFPQPFENLPANFSTNGCQAFFLNFTQDESFRQCRAFSFLLNASASFLTSQRNITLLNNLIYGTCNTRPTLDTCDRTMATLLAQLEDVCATELSNENSIVHQAQIGFQSYTAMRTAACLENAISGRYCYVEALAITPPQDVYFWALPLGTNLPVNVKPTCGACVQSVLAVYSQYVDSMGATGSPVIPGGGTSTGNSSTTSITPSPLPALSKTYPKAAGLAVDTCGGSFANVGLANSGALQNTFAWGLLFIGLFIASYVSSS